MRCRVAVDRRDRTGRGLPPGRPALVRDPPHPGNTPTNITASTVNEAGKLLNLAVEEVQHLARRDHDCGIVVTRTGAGQFTVELSEHVPYVKVCTFLTSELAESNVAKTVDS